MLAWDYLHGVPTAKTADPQAGGGAIKSGIFRCVVSLILSVHYVYLSSVSPSEASYVIK